jgi:biofilm protein TabA
MVVDHIKNADAYRHLGPKIAAALDYLASTDFTNVATGRHELADGLFAMVQQYETGPREEKRWEAHRKYIDVQFVADGSELIGCADIARLEPLTEYDGQNDEMFLAGDGDFTLLTAGTFMILEPRDAHMPRVTFDGKCDVRKVVVKVPV